jgi:ABC-2 type transport system permease protein
MNRQAFKKYGRVYKQIIHMMVALMMTYRLNVVIQGLFSVVYTLGLLFLLEVIFLKTPTLGHWDKDQIFLLFGNFSFMWSLILLFFYEGSRRFCISGVRSGELDTYLTKPVNTQFLVACSFPDITVLPQLLFSLAVLFYEFTKQQLYINSAHLVLFGFFFFVCFIALYFILGIYASLTFFMTNSVQLFRSVENFSDHSQYPTSVYPQILQPLLYSLIPAGLLGYIPTSFLIGKGSWHLGLGAIFVLLISIFINHYSWKHGLRQYSSASS